MGLLFTVGMIALYWAASTYATYAADSSYDRLLAGSAASIAETLSITEDRVTVDIPYAALDMLAAAPNDKVFYRVSGPDGRAVTGYGDLPAVRRSSVEDQAQFFDASYRGDAVRFVVLGREVRLGGQTGWVKVQVGQTREARDALANALTLRALVPILLLTLLAGLVVWTTVGRAVRPLERIGEALIKRTSSDLSPIDEAQAPSEIAPLIGAMNQFMGRLDGNIGLLRSFIANVAHQLRTPLTALMVQLRLAESGASKATRSSLVAAQESAERLARLLDQLLGDAMVMHRADQPQFGVFDLRKAIEQSLPLASPTVWDSDVRFTSMLDEAMVSGDEAMVKEAIKNLVHNALTHGDSPEGVIEIHLARERDGFCLSVLDSGPGVPADVLSDLGKRFKASHSSRGGAGLGLAIVSQVVESHDGKLKVENRAEGGTRVALWFPSA
jgi:two-component system sensor histidine kinase TctE